MMLGEDCYCVIMAGGLGTRLWPLSRKGQPKQFIDFLGDGSTLLKRAYYQCACKLFRQENIFVATNIEYYQEVSDQLPDMDPQQIIREPAIRGTAPCTIMAAMNIETLNPNAKVLMLPSDLLIGCDDNFIHSIQRGMDFVARNDELLTVGIVPPHLETRFGYIQADFNDVRNCLTNGHKTIISTGFATGKNRTYDAIMNALDTNLVSTDKIMESKKVILNFYCSGKYGITTEEMNEVTRFMYNMTERDDIWVKPGFTYDESLGETVRVTILAAGGGDICPDEYKAEYEKIEKDKIAAKLKEDSGKPANRYNLDALNESDDLLRTMRNEKAVTRIPVADSESDENQSDEQ